MSELRRIRSITLPKAKIRRDPGEMPGPILLKISQLRINDSYQRDLSKDSSALTSKIACEFDWELFHLPVVSPIYQLDDITGLQLYEVLDGQHTAIAAASNGNITELWCWPGRRDETNESRADSFRKLNTQRTSVTPVQIFWAEVAAKKENALEVMDACERTGAKVIKRPKPYGNMEVGETICVSTLKMLANRGGRPYVERVLRVAMALRLAPISDIWIEALSLLLFNKNGPHFLKGSYSEVEEAIELCVSRLGVEHLHQKAKIARAGSSASESHPAYWWLAYYIHQDIMSYATARQ